MGEEDKAQSDGDFTVVQDEDERARSKDRSAELPEPEVPGYNVKCRLGAGSYGEGWLAIQKNTGREVAIKSKPPYYVMEYLPGGSLADRLSGSALPEKETVDVFREVVEALATCTAKPFFIAT